MTEDSRPPKFFVPEAEPEEQEAAYSELATASSTTAPPLAERIYSVTFLHDGEEWTATVGKRLQGVTLPPRYSRSRRPFRERQLSDPAVVLAIFPPDRPNGPYIVWTTGTASLVDRPAPRTRRSR